MELVDPVKIYAARSNTQAQMICRLLEAQGIEAFAGEDFSPAGVWIGGTIPGVFDAGVFVSRADGGRAYEFIREYEKREADRSTEPGNQVEATCEECGVTSAFPSRQRGSVQECPRCNALMDIGEVELPGGEGVADELEDG